MEYKLKHNGGHATIVDQFGKSIVQVVSVEVEDGSDGHFYHVPSFERGMARRIIEALHFVDVAKHVLSDRQTVRSA